VIRNTFIDKRDTTVTIQLVKKGCKRGWNMEKNYQSCNFLYSTVMEASVLYNPVSLRVKHLKESIFSIIKYNILPQEANKEVQTEGEKQVPPDLLENEVLNLQPGEWVQVRSLDEISATLDEKGKYKGLYFMPEMKKYCGQKFRVFKKVEIIKLESTGEVRKLRSPSVFLEGVYCNGERHDGCDRACFHFWREIWLKRTPNL
jgi:hypothetical protein